MEKNSKRKRRLENSKLKSRERLNQKRGRPQRGIRATRRRIALREPIEKTQRHGVQTMGMGQQKDPIGRQETTNKIQGKVRDAKRGKTQ